MGGSRKPIRKPARIQNRHPAAAREIHLGFSYNCHVGARFTKVFLPKHQRHAECDAKRRCPQYFIAFSRECGRVAAMSGSPLRNMPSVMWP